MTEIDGLRRLYFDSDYNVIKMLYVFLCLTNILYFDVLELLILLVGAVSIGGKHNSFYFPHNALKISIVVKLYKVIATYNRFAGEIYIHT